MKIVMKYALLILPLLFNTYEAKPVCEPHVSIEYLTPTSNNSCTKCESIVKIIEYENKFVNKSIDSIIKVVETICKDVLDPIGKHECLTILNDTKKIVNWISDGLNSTQICKKLGLCKELNIKDIVVEFKQNITCDTCLLITGIISKEIRLANVTINQVTKIIEDICEMIDNKIISNECIFIDSEIRNIVTWISNGLDTDQICKKLHLCY